MPLIKLQNKLRLMPFYTVSPHCLDSAVSSSAALDPAKVFLVICVNPRSPKYCQILGPGRQ